MGYFIKIWRDIPLIGRIAMIDWITEHPDLFLMVIAIIFGNALAMIGLYLNWKTRKDTKGIHERELSHNFPLLIPIINKLPNGKIIYKVKNNGDMDAYKTQIEINTYDSERRLIGAVPKFKLFHKDYGKDYIPANEMVEFNPDEIKGVEGWFFEEGEVTRKDCEVSRIFKSPMPKGIRIITFDNKDRFYCTCKYFKDNESIAPHISNEYQKRKDKSNYDNVTGLCKNCKFLMTDDYKAIRKCIKILKKGGHKIDYI